MPKDLPDTQILTKRRRYRASDADTTSQRVSPAAIGKACVSKPRFDDENRVLETQGDLQCCR